jgi:hypothetical protein
VSSVFLVLCGAGSTLLGGSVFARHAKPREEVTTKRARVRRALMADEQ